MQLLQMLRDSTSIERYAQHVSKLEERSRELASEIAGFLGGAPSFIITYNRDGFLPASITFWHTIVMNPSSSPLLVDLPTLTYQVLAYRESSPVIGFATNPFSALAPALQVLRLLEYPYLIFTMRPGDQRLEELLRRYEVRMIPSRGEAELSLLLSLSSYHALSEVHRDKLERRGRRLYEHSREGFSGVVPSLIEGFLDALSEVVTEREVYVTSTQLMEGGSAYFAKCLAGHGIDAVYVHPELARGPGSIALISTSAEEPYRRELLSKYRLMNMKVRELYFNTDPLEANIYLSLLAFYLEYLRAEGGSKA